MKFVVLVILTVFCVTPLTALYEDQIGKFDWRQQWIGKLKHVIWETVPRSYPRRIVVGSDTNVVASLSPKTGSLLWRQALEKNEDIKALSIGRGEVVSVSSSTGSGFKVGGWDINRGSLLWNSFLSYPTDKFDNIWVNVIEDEAYVIKGVLNSHFIINGFNLKTGEEISTNSFISAPWFQPQSGCDVTRDYFVCGDAASASLFYIDIVEGTQFSSNILSNFDLKGLSPATPLNLQQCHSCRLANAVVVRADNQASLIQVGSEVKLLLSESAVEALGVLEVDGKVYTYSLFPDRRLVFVDRSELNSVLEIPSLYGEIEFISPCLFAKKDNFLTYRVLAVTKDDAILVFQPPGKLSWFREEALASIEAVEMIDLPVSPADAVFEEEFKNTDNLLSMLMHRINSQVSQLRSLLLGMTVTGQLPIKPTLTRDSFNLHKMIVAVTSAGKVYGLDNTDGDIVWSRLIPSIKRGFHENSVRLYIQRSSSHVPFSPQAVIVGFDKDSGGGLVFAFNPLTGEDIDKDSSLVRYSQPLVATYLLQQMSGEFIHPLVVIDESLTVHVYPACDSKVILKNKDKLYVYLADNKQGVITGYSFKDSTLQKLSLSEVWKVNLLAENDEIIKIVSKRCWERVHSQGRVMGDRSVLFKYTNPNLIAVITQGFHQSVKSYLNVYLLDSVTGHIVHAVSHKRSRGPVLAVHSENWLVYSYYNEKGRRIEIASLELYEGKQQVNATAFSSLSHPVSVMVEQQSFILPTGGLDALRDTVTEKGITSKHILFALSSGGIVELPWMFLDPRRPLALTPEQREEGLIPYMPELPLPPEATISYNLSLSRVRDIYTTHTGLESTSLVFVYGLDVFYTRVTPSKTFDILKDDFDHYFICLVLLALLVASYISKQLAARKALMQAWK